MNIPHNKGLIEEFNKLGREKVAYNLTKGKYIENDKITAEYWLKYHDQGERIQLGRSGERHQSNANVLMGIMVVFTLLNIVISNIYRWIP